MPGFVSAAPWVWCTTICRCLVCNPRNKAYLASRRDKSMQQMRFNHIQPLPSRGTLWCDHRSLAQISNTHQPLSGHGIDLGSRHQPGFIGQGWAPMGLYHVIPGTSMMSGQRMASLEINYQDVEDALTPGELAYLPRGRIYATWYTPDGDMNQLLNYQLFWCNQGCDGCDS